MRTRPPGRPPDRAVRPREYLTPEEVERLRTAAASRGRHGPRDAAMILLAYRPRSSRTGRSSTSGGSRGASQVSTRSAPASSGL
jgi:hypothetical protein